MSIFLNFAGATQQSEEVKILNFEFPRAAYIHIPFCRHRCYYCDFPISVLGGQKTNGTSSLIEEYIEALCQEIALTPVRGQPLTTLFFGGGTPSLLCVRQLEKIILTLEEHFGITTEAEISIEIDPGTFSKEQLQGYQNAGVTRVSLGVQAFQDKFLQVCGRSHSCDDIFSSIDIIRRVGISNLSFDLISGLPHQTLANWQDSLATAISLAPNHISCYDLVIEPVTAFGKQYQPGTNPLPTDEVTAQMYRLAQQTLTSAGYEHYEISNYAQPGYKCCHNQVYWRNQPYYGFGMGAASYIQRQRFTRPRTRKEYYIWVGNLVQAGGILDIPETSTTDILLETLMLGFRLAEGVSLSQISQQFGEEILERIWRCLQVYYYQGWVEIIDMNGEVIEIDKDLNLPISAQLRLTDPEGFLFSNTILSTLFNQLGIVDC